MAVAPPAVKTVAFPKTLGAAIDTLYSLREERLAAQKIVDAKQVQETALHAHIIQKLEEQDMEGSKGALATASIQRSTQADVFDWNEYCKYMAKNKAWDMVQQRASITALRARWDNKVDVPGVRPVVVKKLSVTKSSKSKE